MSRMSLRPTAVVLVCLFLSACGGSTKIISSWQAEPDDINKRQRIAVVVMLPEALQRLTTEQEIVRIMRKSGRNALVSSDIPGLSGSLSREKAEPALKAASVEAIVIVFLTRGAKGEKLERNDYYAVMVDSGFYSGGYGWFAPQFVNVYTIREGEGFYAQERYLYVETTYFDIVDDRAKWSMITRSKNLEYNDTAKSVAKEIVSRMRATGTL